MLKIINGEAGSGKTKQMLQQANAKVDASKGELVYIDYNDKHMHQLHRDIRFVCITDYKVETLEGIYGFICGIISDNYDIETIFIDGIDVIIHDVDQSFTNFVHKIDKIAGDNKVDMLISANLNNQEKESLEKFLF